MTNKITNVSAIEFVLDNFDIPEEYAEKLTKIRDSYANKSGNRKPTKQQELNKIVKANLQTALANAGKAMTVSEILASDKVTFDGITGQRASALLKQMVEVDKTAEKFVEKKKSYFRAV